MIGQHLVVLMPVRRARRAGAGRGVIRALAVGGWWLWSAIAVLGEPSLAASLDRDLTVAGESVTMSVVFQDAVPKSVPTIPAVAGLNLRYLNAAQNVQSINGQTTRSVTLYFLVVPTQAGEFTIPSIQAQVDGTALSSRPLRLTALRPEEFGAPPANPLAKYGFVRLAVPKRQFYVGEAVAVQIWLYVLKCQEAQEPGLRTDGFTVLRKAPAAQFQTQIGAQVYSLISVQMAVIANQPGSISLGPAEWALELGVPLATPRRTGPFGMFSETMEWRPAKLSSNPQAVTVLPLPAQDEPRDFQGAIGQYAMTVSASPTNLTVGDPITIKLRIEGRGNFDTLNGPRLNDWREFKIYPAAGKAETSDPLALEGIKVFEQVVTPQSTDVKRLPPISFSFFDPVQRAYRTMTHPAIPLIVRPSGSPSSPTVIMANAAAGGSSSAASRDIVHIKIRPGPLAALQIPWAQRPWFWLLQGLPILVWLAGVVWRKRCDELERNPRLRRERMVRRLLREWLAELDRLAAANEADEFFALLFRMLQEQLGERLDLPASAITEAVIDEQLRPRGVPEETLERLQELFRECDQVRFAPAHSLKMLGDLAPKVGLVIGELQALPDPQPRGGS